MDNTLYVGLSYQMAIRRNMDVISNNLANMNTTAFKRESVLFQEFLQDVGQGPQGRPEEIAFVFDLGLARNYEPGNFIETGNPLDIAITERGFLVVEGDNGEILYTRNGHLQVDESGRLVTPSGHPILDEDGAEIILNDNDRNISIATDGTISSEIGEIAKIQLVEFAPDQEQFLKKTGDSLFTAEVEPEPAVQAKIMQGKVEGSNVEPIQEMVKMMQLVRSYQSTSQMLEQYEQMQNRAVERIGRVQ